MNSDIRICFVGDSLANGAGDETTLGWAGRVCATAIARGLPITYYNLGVRRETSTDILLRWEHECAHRLPDSCDGRVVLSCGVNDTVMEDGKMRVSLDESCANLRQMIASAKNYTMLIVGPPPVDDEAQNTRIHAISVAFAHETERLGVSYIELYTPLAVDTAYKKDVVNHDGYHPSSYGYSQIARLVASSPHWWFHAP